MFKATSSTTKRFLRLYYITPGVIIYLFLFVHFASAQETSYPFKIDSIKKMVDQQYYQMSESVFESIEKGLQMSLEQQDSLSMAFFYLRKGVAYDDLLQGDKSVEYYFKAADIYKSLNHEAGLASTYGSMAVNTNLPQAKKAELLYESLRISECLGDTLRIQQAYNNLGTYYSSYRHLDSALFYHNKYLEIAKDKKQLKSIAGAYCNIGRVYCRIEGQKDKGMKMLYEAKNILPLDNHDYLVKIYANLMLEYLWMNQADSAFHYFNLIKPYFAIQPNIEIISYEQVSDFYEKNGDHRNALQYFKKADSVKKARFELNDEKLLSFLELEYESKLKEKELIQLNTEMEKAGYIRSFLILLVLVIVVFSTIVIVQLKLKSRKKKELNQTKQELLKKELKHSHLEKQYLNDELKYTNKELASFATNIVQNHDILVDIKNQISAISKEKSLKKIKEKISYFHATLVQIFNNNIQRREFIKRSRQLNHSLIYYLKTNFPQLTDGDINLLILILLKFRSKEISVLYNIEPGSVTQRRYRLRKKLGIENWDSFDNFFGQVLPKIRQVVSVAENVD